MTHRVSRRIQRLQLYRATNLDDVTRLQPDIYARDRVACVLVGEQLGAGSLDHRLIAADVIVVLVSIDYLSNGPAFVPGRIQAFVVVQRIHRQCFSGLAARDEIVEVPPVIPGPDLFDNHSAYLDRLKKSRI